MVSETEPIVIYDGGSAGYGDAISAGRRSYAMTMNMDNRAEGRAVPAVVPTGLGIGATDIPRDIGAVFEWEKSDGTPIILVAGAAIDTTIKRSVGRVEGGTFYVEDIQTGEGYTGGFLYRHDGDDPDTPAAFFCNGDDQDIIRRRNIDGTYSTPDDAKADLLAVVGSHAWRTLGYKIAKVRINTEVGTAANSPTQIPAGRSFYDINTVLELGGSPLLLKGDGVFRYNPAPSAATFQNMTSFVPAHKDNGKGGFTDGRGRVYFFTVDGDVLVISFGTQSQQRPTRFTRFNRDTPFGRIGEMVADANQVYATVDPGSRRTQQLGLTVKTFNAADSVYNDHTTALTGA